jgi:hypothetical protein
MWQTKKFDPNLRASVVANGRACRELSEKSVAKRMLFRRTAGAATIAVAIIASSQLKTLDPGNQERCDSYHAFA